MSRVLICRIDPCPSFQEPRSPSMTFRGHSPSKTFQRPSEAKTLIMSKAFQFPGHDVVFELVFSNVQIQRYLELIRSIFHLPGLIYSQLHSIAFEFLFQKPISYFSDCKPIPRRQDINNDVCIVLLTRHCHCLYKIQLSILLRSLFYISFLCFN